MHLESSKLLVDEFARLVLPFGTTAVVADPHEIANVLGTDGVHWLLDATAGLPLDVYFMASSCVPASQFESPRRELTPGRPRRAAPPPPRDRPRRDDELPRRDLGATRRELAKLALAAARRRPRARRARPRRCNAYAAAGIRSDHEAYTRRGGPRAAARRHVAADPRGSAARNLQALLPLLAEYGPGRIAFCTDDREPEHIADDGHINSMVRDAVAFGIPPEDALVCATLNPALWHGLAHLGAVAPGYQADLLVLPDLERFVPDVVLKARPAGRGDPARRGARLGAAHGAHRRVRAGDVPHPVGGRRGARDRASSRARSSPTRSSTSRRTRAGEAIADPERDLAKIAVVERHLGTGRVGLGFVRGFGLQRGALASTVAHDAHNVVVVGMNDASMAAAVRRLANRGGGIVVVDGAEVLAELPLPVAGLLSDAPLDEVRRGVARALVDAARELGCTLEAPFQHLAFLALSRDPELKLTDRGLVDVDRFELVPLEAA